MSAARDKKRKPKHWATPAIGKQPSVATEPLSLYDQHPAWRVSMLEMLDPFGWRKVSADVLSDVRRRLSDFERMTWREILVSGGKQNHRIGIHQLCPAARARLEEINQADIDHLISLRVTGKARVWGILESNVLNVLWWDPDHQVCPSIKKHT